MTAASKLMLEPSVWFFAGQFDESAPVRRIPITSMPFQIGRRSDLALSLRCSSVSKLHAEIHEEDDGLWLDDLGSTNGTYVNGERIDGPTRLDEGDLVQFATMVFRVGCAQHQLPERATIEHDACDVALSTVQFDRLLHDDAVVPFYQPIMRLDDGNPTRVAYEVLGRSRLFGLTSPKQMFATASQLNLEADLSRVFRRQGIRVAGRFPEETHLYVNTHPIEVGTLQLVQSLREVREASPTMPITLEIHEAAVANPSAIRKLRDVLQDLDMQLAFDDFGSGQARLIELSEARPHCVKFDIQLVKGIAAASLSRQRVLAMLVQMVHELGITPLAEGVETEPDHDALCQMGFVLGQGFYYGRPAAMATHLAAYQTDTHALGSD